MLKFVGISIFVLYLLHTGEGLQCYRCENYVTDTDSSLLQDLKSKSNPLCDQFTPLSAEQETCPDDGQHKCGMVKGSATTSIPFVGSVTIKTTVRGCMPVVRGTPNGCVDNDSQANKAVKDIMNAGLSTVLGFTVDGNVCYCDTDFCSACDNGEAGVGGFCLPIWAWCLIAAGAVLALIPLTCCCCCCCCRPCRRKRQATYGHTMVPVTITTTQPNGTIGIANPGYGQQPLVANNGY